MGAVVDCGDRMARPAGRSTGSKNFYRLLTSKPFPTCQSGPTVSRVGFEMAEGVAMDLVCETHV